MVQPRSPVGVCPILRSSSSEKLGDEWPPPPVLVQGVSEFFTCPASGLQGPRLRRPRAQRSTSTTAALTPTRGSGPEARDLRGRDPRPVTKLTQSAF